MAVTAASSLAFFAMVGFEDSVVKARAPNLPIKDILPFISMFAVSNTALINMLMASRLI